MLDSLSNFSQYFLPHVQEEMSFSLKEQHKKILLVASVALALFAAAYLMCCYNKKQSISKADESKKTPQPTVDPKTHQPESKKADEKLITKGV